jgi:hypothetical protein
VNEIIQHIPGFVDIGDGPVPRADFSTLEELLAVPFVARWKDEGFIKWSKSDDLLMVEFWDKGEDKQWVVGRLKDPTAVDLPEWIESPTQRERREKWNAQWGRAAREGKS